MAMQMQIEREPSMLSVPVGNDDIIVTDLSGKFFALNPSASAVWKALETPQTVEQVCTALCGEFEVTIEVCRTDVQALVSDWRKLGLVRTVD